MQIAGHLKAVMLVCLAVLGSASVHAEDAILAVTMAGEAYDGAPKFRLTADTQVIATGEIANALDTAKGGRLNPGDSAKLPGAERFVFAVPNIQSVSQFEIEFINDAWAGKDKAGDRNLYILGLSLSIVKTTAAGSSVEIRDFSPAQFQAIIQNPQGAVVTAQYSALFQEGRLRLKRPEGGWTAWKTASETKQAPPATLPCRRARLELKGFVKNGMALSPDMLERLGKAGKELRGNSCSARVTAYASGGPSDAFRTKLALARAEAVASELAKLGLARDRIKTASAPGGGRRVVISFE